MNVPLLQTKLFIPQLRSEDIVPRSLLCKRLQWHTGQRLTLLSAPAGFGKTTLVAAWLAERREAHLLTAPSRLPDQPRAKDQTLYAWLSLDENDNEINRFLAYWIAAIQCADSTLGHEAQSMLQAPQTLSVENLLTRLINELAAYPNQLVLVLDDYHVIEDVQIHKAVGFWLDHAPPHCHLVLTTRTDPPLSLALLRSRGQVNEIRTDDLRFAEEEIAQFFLQVMGLNLSTTNVQALASRTEGWVAGLKMTSLSLRGCDDITEFITHFTGSHRFIIDYLADQVLDRCSVLHRQFLLQTSVLGKMCAPLVDAVMPDIRSTHGCDSQSILEELEAANLFIVPLDEERRWYRYHQLFGELLLHRLRRADSTLEATLHLRASLWYEQEGSLNAAIDHALVGQDFSRAAALIESVAIPMTHSAEIYTLNRWLEALPHQLVLQRPQLALAYTLVLSTTNRFNEFDVYVQAIEEIATANPEEPTLQRIRGQVCLMQSATAALFGHFEKSRVFAEQAEEILQAFETRRERWVPIADRGYVALFW
ncbi:AAA family ATPase [Chloroflexi bacterium TSY]|nr:AAA family ATPase [Chloroflexi bacterium TSY]